MNHDYRKLIEEAREYAGNDSIPMPLALRLADALESVLAERDALAAQIAAAKALPYMRAPLKIGAIQRILSADPAEILQERDARVTEAAYDHGVSEGYAVALSDVESGKGNNVRAEKVRQAVRAEVIDWIERYHQEWDAAPIVGIEEARGHFKIETGEKR